MPLGGFEEEGEGGDTSHSGPTPADFVAIAKVIDGAIGGGPGSVFQGFLADESAIVVVAPEATGFEGAEPVFPTRWWKERWVHRWGVVRICRRQWPPTAARPVAPAIHQRRLGWGEVWRALRSSPAFGKRSVGSLARHFARMISHVRFLPYLVTGLNWPLGSLPVSIR